MISFDVGKKVKLLYDVIEHACGDHPALLYAKAGDILVVRKHAPYWDYPIQVSHEDVADKTFGVTADEIETAE